jgi:hypothetical protein
VIDWRSLSPEVMFRGAKKKLSDRYYGKLIYLPDLLGLRDLGGPASGRIRLIGDNQ